MNAVRSVLHFFVILLRAIMSSIVSKTDFTRTIGVRGRQDTLAFPT